MSYRVTGLKLKSQKSKVKTATQKAKLVFGIRYSVFDVLQDVNSPLLADFPASLREFFYHKGTGGFTEAHRKKQ